MDAPEIIVEPFTGTREEFFDVVSHFFVTNEVYRGYSQLVDLVTNNVGENHDLYIATSDGATAGVAAVVLSGSVLKFDVLVVSTDFREIGVGDALFNDISQMSEYSSATHFESTALPGDRLTKNFFESRGGKARLLIVAGEL